MIWRQQMGCLRVVCLVLGLIIAVEGVNKTASFTCRKSGDATTPILTVDLIVYPHDSPVKSITAVNATEPNALMAEKNLSCQVLNTDTTTELRLTFVTTLGTSPSIPCSGKTLADGTVVFVVILHAYSEILYSRDDGVYQLPCNVASADGKIQTANATPLADYDGSSDGSGGSGGSGGGSAPPVITPLRKQPGLNIYLRAAGEGPTTIKSDLLVGEKVKLSMEYLPNRESGPDSWGRRFVIGLHSIFTSNTTTTGVPAFIVMSKYPDIATEVYMYSELKNDTKIITVNESGFWFPQVDAGSLLCSKDRNTEISNKGIEIYSPNQEIAVFVVNMHPELTATGFLALPVDVAGTDHLVALVAPAVGGTLDLTVVGQEDNTEVTITLPAGASVLVNGTEQNVIKATIGRRGTIHVSLPHTPSADLNQGTRVISTKPVSVFGGITHGEDKNSVTQFPPVDTLGTDYVLTWAEQADKSEYVFHISTPFADTTVKRYSTATQTLTRDMSSGYYTETLGTFERVELFADKPIQIVMSAKPSSGDTGDFYGLLVLPAVHQWASNYSFRMQHLEYSTLETYMMFSGVGQDDDMTLSMWTHNSQAVNDLVTWKGVEEVTGPKNYYSKLTTLTSRQIRYSVGFKDEPRRKFMLLLSKKESPSLLVLPAGYRYPKFGACANETLGHRGDLADNDCDGKIDEEWENGKDDDGDGKIDEDTRYEYGNTGGFDWAQPNTCIVTPVAGETDPRRIIHLYDSNSCPSNTSVVGPFYINITTGFMSHEQSRGYFSAGDMKIVYSAEFEVGMFVGYNTLQFTCIFDLCTTLAACNPCIPAATRRKRAAETYTQTGNLVTTQATVRLPENIALTQNPSYNGDVIVSESVDLDSCLRNASVLTLLGVFLTTSLVCFLSAVFLACLYRRRRKREQSRYSDSTTYTDSISHLQGTSGLSHLKEKVVFNLPRFVKDRF